MDFINFLKNLQGIPNQAGNFLRQFIPQSQPEAREPISPLPNFTPTPTVTPTPTPMGTIPGGTDIAMNYIRGQLPSGRNTEEYYPAFGNQEFMGKIAEADKLRQGLSNLLLLQALFESTGGRTTSNIFGVKPGGRSGMTFPSPVEALNYQLSPNALGSRDYPNMNILNETTPLTLDRIKQLYESYNKGGSYTNTLLSILGGASSNAAPSSKRLSSFFPSQSEASQYPQYPEYPEYFDGGLAGYRGSPQEKSIDRWLSQWDNYIRPLQARTPRVRNIPFLELLKGYFPQGGEQ